MKKHIYLAVLSLLPFAALAQPTLNKAESYTPGTVVKTIGSDPVAAGNAGANQTWNFAGLTKNDSTKLTYLASVASSPFPSATLVEKSEDSTYRFFSNTATTTHLMGLVDSSQSGDNAKLTYNNTLLLMQRPLSYNATATDSFEHTLTSGLYAMHGKGETKMKVDGYGTLTLPNGSYNNVLRIRIETNQKDSVSAPINMSFITKTVSYLWYDNEHKAALLRIDSMDSGGVPDVTVTYLSKEESPVGISSFSTKKIPFYAFFNRGELNISGELETGKSYSLDVRDMAGRNIHSEVFTAQGDKKNIVLQSAAPAGIYLVSVMQNDGKATGYVKVAKDH